MIYDFAQNKQKLQRILDKMPNASEEAIKAEYIKNAGLLNKEEGVTFPTPIKVKGAENVPTTIITPSKKTVKKVTKK